MELAVKLLKHRLRSDHTTFCGNSAEYDQIRDLITRTSENGESNSALVIGTAGCGKTTVKNHFSRNLHLSNLTFLPMLLFVDDYINFGRSFN